ncbi:MAG: polysaccharide deacetylase family protein [Candidatus Methylomirabilales bacterium]
MKATHCPSHPNRLATHQCFRCRARICRVCTIWIGRRPFCDKGCSVIHVMQQAADAEWRAHECLIREVPISLRLRWFLHRSQRALRTQRRALRSRALAVPVRLFQPAMLLRWTPLVIAPLVLLLYWRGNLPTFPPSVPIEREVVTPAEVPPVPTAAPDRLGKPADLVPPEISRHPQFPPETSLSRGPTWERKIALTFDGGSEANVTEDILDTLKSKGVRATIFLTGEYILNYPDLVRRMIEEGHEIGNHTYSHPHLTTFSLDRRQETLAGVTKEFVQNELRLAARLFEKVTGGPMSSYWRAPYGEHNRDIRRWAAEVGYLHVGWTRDPATGEDLDTRDWVVDPDSPIYYRAEEVRERILTFGKGTTARANGGIILLHLGTQRKEDRVHRQLPVIIDGLRMQGYDLVPVSELHQRIEVGEEEKGSVLAAE